MCLMVRKLFFGSLAAAVLSLGLLVISGCSQSNDNPRPSTEDRKPDAKGKGEEHAHKPGAHGGIMVTIGRDSYHAEAVFEKGGLLRLYMLGSDESKVIDVDSQTLTAYAKPEGGTDSQAFEMKATPQDGDAKGRTSQFTGRLPRELWGKKVEVTIPSLRINDERFRLGFTNAAVAHVEEPMPNGLSDDDEKKLYL